MTSDFELPGMWEESDFTGGQDEVRGPYQGKALEELEELGDIMDSEEYRHPDRRLPVRKADAAQYEREPIPEEQRGQIRVRLLNQLPDPLGSIAALCKQYEGVVIRDLSQLTRAERMQALDDMTKTVLNGPLEVAQFHFQVEGVTRSITHQMVRSRVSFFAQESLRFAVPEGDWSEEIPLPPWLAGTRGGHPLGAEPSTIEYARNLWDENMRNAARTYAGLIEAGMPAEEARGVIPHDMPTRLHWVVDLRTLLQEAGKRTCTQAQFPWRMLFAGVANALRERGHNEATYREMLPIKGNSTYVHPCGDGWQFLEMARRIRPVCYQTGSCGFMAKFDRSCNIRSRVDANAKIGRPSADWGKTWLAEDPAESIEAINDAEWALNPGAARS